VKLWCKEILTVSLFTFYNFGFHTQKKIKIGYASVERTQEFSVTERQTIKELM